MTNSAEPGLRERADSLLALTMKAAGAYNRPELVARLERRRERLHTERVSLVVIGEFKAGKSSLINAALGANLCPTDDAIATAVPTIIRHGTEVAAAGLRALDGRTERTVIPFDERGSEIREDGRPEPLYTAIELTVPRAVLATGLELIDTPGVGGLRSSHTAAALAAAEDAEAAIFVTDASQELSGPELTALLSLVDRCPNVLIVLTKCDLFPEWHRIKQLNEAHLERAGLDLPILATSAPLRTLAVGLRDQELNVESGYAELLSILRDDVAGQADAFAIDQVTYDLGRVIDVLVSGFELERSALTDPEEAARVQRELQAATERAEQLKRDSARWGATLNDGVNDLMADMDHDLRRRVRSVTAEASRRVEELDPRQSWDEFTPWLEEEVAAELLANNHLLHERTEELAVRVLDHFQREETEVDVAAIVNDLSATEHGAAIGDLDLQSTNAVKQILGGLRGSYSGLLMFGAFGGIAGVAVATPVLAGIGLLLGARQVRDERSKQLKAHRQQAIVSIRKYIEDVTFVANKASRDSVKIVQRNLRDHCSAVAGEAQEQIRQTLAAVREARTADDRAGRIKDIDAELERLRRLRAAVESLCD